MLSNETTVNEFFEQLKTLTIENALDIATGKGEFIGFIKDTVESVNQIIGIDTHPGMLGMAKKTYQDANFQEMDGYKLDFEDKSFDMVAISNSLHHLDNPKDVLSEMNRVLSDGGYYLIREMLSDVDQDESQKSHIMIHHLSAEVDRLMGRVHNITYTYEELLELLKQIPTTKHDIIVYDYPIPSEDRMKYGESYLPLVDAILKPIQDTEHFQKLQLKADKIKEHMKKHGFAPARTLYYLGTK